MLSMGGFPCDMWAAGISMYMMMFGGRHPFFIGGAEQLDMQALIRGKLDFRVVSSRADVGRHSNGQGILRYSDAAQKICTAMAEPNPTRRITAQAALQDPWFSNPAVPKGVSRRSTVPVSQHPGDQNVTDRAEITCLWTDRSTCQTLMPQVPTLKNRNSAMAAILEADHQPIFNLFANVRSI